MNKETINIKAEYEPVKIRHAVVQCPNCKNWFDIMDCASDTFGWSRDDLKFEDFYCPKCEKSFSGNNFDLNIEEVYHENFPKCLKKKVSWE